MTKVVAYVTLLSRKQHIYRKASKNDFALYYVFASFSQIKSLLYMRRWKGECGPCNSGQVKKYWGFENGTVVTLDAVRIAQDICTSFFLLLFLGKRLKIGALVYFSAFPIP